MIISHCCHFLLTVSIGNWRQLVKVWYWFLVLSIIEEIIDIFFFVFWICKSAFLSCFVLSVLTRSDSFLCVKTIRWSDMLIALSREKIYSLCNNVCYCQRRTGESSIVYLMLVIIVFFRCRSRDILFTDMSVCDRDF